MNQNDAQWVSLFNEAYNCLDKVYTFGGEWAIECNIANENLFWKSVFESWRALYRTTPPVNNTEIVHSCSWYNYHISKRPLYFPKWFKRGIGFVGDLVNERGKIMTREELKQYIVFQ